MEIKILKEEYWYGGCAAWGGQMPLGERSEADLQLEPNPTPNQAMPLLVSSRGRYLWLDGVEEVKFSGGYIHCQGTAELYPNGEQSLQAAAEKQTLRDAYQKAMERHFPFSGKIPAKELFEAPVFNTWIELTFDQNQQAVLRYARNILDSGFRPGVLMIDDGWAECYGDWQFHKGRFPDPAGMLRDLHGLGFKVMLWVCPYVTPDSKAYREAVQKGFLLQNESGGSFVAEWWNGFSAAVDLSTHPARSWLDTQLEALRGLGVDGFKFDGGDPTHYVGAYSGGKAVIPNEMSHFWAEFGLRYPLNEYRSAWKAGGLPLMQRLCDKDHSWGKTGLAALIPDLLAQGITGHPFGCADLVGGGEYLNFQKNAGWLDRELFLKHAAVSCLTPVIQFSAAPWRILNADQLRTVHAQLAVRRQWQEYLEQVLCECARTGAPAVRYMEYEFPHQGMEQLLDQYMLGSRLLVAPVLEKGKTAREVYIPRGEWLWEGKLLHSRGEVLEFYAPDTFLIVLERQ